MRIVAPSTIALEDTHVCVLALAPPATPTRLHMSEWADSLQHPTTVVTARYGGEMRSFLIFRSNTLEEAQEAAERAAESEDLEVEWMDDAKTMQVAQFLTSGGALPEFTPQEHHVNQSHYVEIEPRGGPPHKWLALQAWPSQVEDNWLNKHLDEGVMVVCHIEPQEVQEVLEELLCVTHQAHKRIRRSEEESRVVSASVVIQYYYAIEFRDALEDGRTKPFRMSVFFRTPPDMQENLPPHCEECEDVDVFSSFQQGRLIHTQGVVATLPLSHSVEASQESEFTHVPHVSELSERLIPRWVVLAGGAAVAVGVYLARKKS